MNSARVTSSILADPNRTAYELPPELLNRRAALIVAHPGHELRVHGWLELARPVVCVLTDGSGHTNQSRLSSTTVLLDNACAKPGTIYGRLTDVAAYEAMLNKDFRFFIELADELAEILVANEIEYVVGDPIEGYNPTHDICRAVINAAVDLALRTSRHPIANFDFQILGQPNASLDKPDGQVSVHLDDPAMDRKLAAAGAYSELSSYVGSMINEFGTEILEIESLRPVQSSPLNSCFSGPPFYEEYGEKQVAAGVYGRVIRYSEHILPISSALMDYSQK